MFLSTFGWGVRVEENLKRVTLSSFKPGAGRSVQAQNLDSSSAWVDPEMGRLLFNIVLGITVLNRPALLCFNRFVDIACRDISHCLKRRNLYTNAPLYKHPLWC